MNKKATSIICYLTWIGWLIAFLAGDKKGARLHLNQSLVIVICQLIVMVASAFLGRIFGLGLLLHLANIILFVCEVVGIVWAAQDLDKELPIFGSINVLN